MSAELLRSALKDDDAVTSEAVNHNSNSNNVFVKRAFIHNNLPPVDCNNSLHRSSIIGDAWEDDTTVQNSHKEPTLDDNNSISKSERLMRGKLQKMMIWRIMHNFLSATSCHGLPLIASTKSFCCALAFWMIPIMIALGLMLWALISVTTQYLKMNTVLYSNLHFNSRLLFPAVTICNKNYYRKSVAESTGINLDELVDFLHVASGNPFLVEDFDFDAFYKNHMDLFNQNDSIFYYRVSGHQLEQMVYSCTFNGKDCSQNFTQRISFFGNCYTFNSGIDTSILYSARSGERYGLELTLNAEEYEYFLAESITVGFNVFIHDQAHFPYFDSTDRFSVTTGQETMVALRKADYTLLTSDGGGQCRDDVDLKYFESYAYTSCLTECFTDYIVDACRCKFEFLPGPARVCNISDDCQYTKSAEFNEMELCDCPIACDFNVYERSLSYSKFPASHFAALLKDSDSYLSRSDYDFPDFIISTRDENGREVPYLNENFTQSFLTDNTLVLRIYYDTLTSTSVEEGLEYSTFQFIADFGGHIGLFTGAGFLTIFEIIQLCCGLIKPAYGLAYV